MINSFRNEYHFLSNMYDLYDNHGVFINYKGIYYRSSEHAYVSAKTSDVNEKIYISKLETAKQAKRYGKSLILIDNWNNLKTTIMRDILELKFNIPELELKLINTGETELIEQNTWGDQFWGVCDGVGKNMLGKILMSIRNEKKMYM